MTDLNQTAQTIEQLLLAEESKPITSRSAVAISELHRRQIHLDLFSLEKSVSALRARYASLPEMPNQNIMDWAESVLCMRSLAVTVADTTGLDEQGDDLIRVHIRNADGIILDQFIKPLRVPSANTPYTGIRLEQLNDAPTLTEAWEEIIKPALSGCFVVSFGLPFVRKMIEGNREYYGLSRLPFRGEDLMSQARTYFQIGTYEKGFTLASAVARIGKPFPYSPPTADVRATGILALLLAMSQGVTSAPQKIDTNTDLDELNEGDHPF